MIPMGTRKAAPRLATGLCRKTGPLRKLVFSHCWPVRACTRAS